MNTEPLSQAGQTRTCPRCGRPCQVAPDRNPDARPVRRANRGHCLECALTSMLKNDLNIDFLLEGNAATVAEVLAAKHIQAQLETMLAAGGCDLDHPPDWPRIIANWDLDATRRGLKAPQ